jgi:WD40 repeat protein
VTVAPTSPFKGLSAFEDSELDALFFFGREREREIVVANLIASRLTVLYGPSGVGKSSLLRAAVARSLRELPEDPLVVVFSSWSDDPNQGLAQAVREAAGLASNGSATEALTAAQAERDVYLVLDQAEEYFLYHADDSGPGSFAEALPAVLGTPQRVNVLVSLREDSLAKLDRFTGRIPGLFANTLRLDRLDRAAARAAITRPVERYAALAGAAIVVEPALIDAVLDEVGTGQIELTLGGLGTVEGEPVGTRIEAPYLQLVMQRLWEEERAAGSGVLRAGTLARLGGAQHIVEEHLDGAMAELSSEQKDVAARLFNHLVTPSGTKIAHEVSDLADFGETRTGEVELLLATLAGRRIVRSVDDGERYEIFHDVLAQPVLAWRAGYEAAREVEEERARAGRKQRRLLAVIALGIVLLAAMAGVTAYALTQRSEAQEQAALAEQNAVTASQNAADADAQRTRAEKSAAEAEKQRKLAEKNAAEAQQQADIAARNEEDAQQQAEIADQQAAAAQQAQGEAQAATKTAQNEATKARKQKLAADLARGRAVRAATSAHARALAEQALTMLATRPLEALRVALHSYEVQPSARAEPVLRATLVSARVRHVLPGGGGETTRAMFSPDGRTVLTVADRARLFDVPSGRLIRALPDPSRVTSAAFAPDGATVVTAGADGRARIWRSQGGARARIWHAQGGAPFVVARHEGAIEDVSFTADGRFVATASADRTAALWNVSTGDRVATYEHDGPVFAVMPNADTSVVVTVSRVARTGRRVARLFEADSGRLIRTLDQIGITTAIFSPDGKLVVTTSTDDTARVWGLDSAQPKAVLSHPDGNVVSAEFSRDGTKLVTASEGSAASVWLTSTWEKDFAALGQLNPLTDASFSADGRFLALASRDRNVHLFNADNGFRLGVLPGHGEAVLSVAFSPDGRSLLSASADGSARIWDPGIQDPLRVVGTTRDAAIRRVAVSPRGRVAATAEADGTVRILDVVRRRDLHVMRHDAAVNDVTFSLDGSRVLTASDDGTARIWRLDGTLERTLVHGGHVLRAVFSNDGTRIVTAGDDHSARIWRARDGARLAVLRGHTGRVLDVAISPDGARVATAGDSPDNTARLWSMSGEQLHVLRHRGPVVRVRFSPTGDVLATASGDEISRIWRIDNGRLVHVLKGHTQFVRDLAFRPDGKVLATASDDGDARVWSVRSGTSLKVLRGHFSSVQGVAFSPDGRWIVTAGPRTAGLWDARTGRLFSPSGSNDPFLRGPLRGPVSTAVFSPDGRWLVTGSGDGTVRSLECTICGRLGSLVRLARTRLAELDRGLTAAERRRFLKA